MEGGNRKVKVLFEIDLPLPKLSCKLPIFFQCFFALTIGLVGKGSPLRLCGARKDSTEENLPEGVPKGTVELLSMRGPSGGKSAVFLLGARAGKQFSQKEF